MAPSEPIKVIVADPPWSFDDKLPGPGRGAAKHYSTLAVSKITAAMEKMSMGIDVADDATLLLWRVAAMQREALDVISDLGFTQKSEMIWIKRTKTGKRHFGMGRQVRMEHEVCLIATSGRGASRTDAGIRSTFEDVWPDVVRPSDGVTPYGGEDFVSVVFSAEASRRHSEKPKVFFDIVERLYEGPYLELFAREQRPGWICRGDQLPEAAGE